MIREARLLIGQVSPKASTFLRSKKYRECRRAFSASTANRYGENAPAIILGIESSCDDTGCGIVDQNRNILGQGMHSQLALSVKLGGVLPPIATDIHQQKITGVCEDALRSAGLKLKDITAIATTVKPGIQGPLGIGLRFGKYLAEIGRKPFIPIHHMEAHALTARLTNQVNFPFLVLLVSGGHSILAIAENVDSFYTLGTTIDNSPGEAMDKVARRLKLHLIPGLERLSGGHALELAARKASDLTRYAFTPTMPQIPDCNFSFGGISSMCMKYIEREERKYDINADRIIPGVYDLCGAYQYTVIKHICDRTQRAMQFVDELDIMPEDDRTLVVSGGVASNDTLAKALGFLCEDFGYQLARPPRNLCTDNGVMVAWNGMERWTADKGVLRDWDEIQNVTTSWKAPLGENWSERVLAKRIKLKRLRLLQRLS